MGRNKLSFDNGLRKARKAKHLTQEAFAEKIGVSPQTVRKWEGAKYSPTVDTFIQLCSFFDDCDADYLLDNLEVPTHELDFVCKYTGLSAAAVEKLHEIACAPGRDIDALKYFSDFIFLFCGRFMHKLLLLEQSVSLAEEALHDGEINMGYAQLRTVLFDFSEFCKKIPEGLFNSGKLFEELERKASYRAVNVSEADAVEFIKNSD